MSDFVRVGTVAEFRRGHGRAVVVDGVRVAVFRTSAGFVAVGDRCAHMGASLADGRLDGDRVECSWHAWAYDVRTGRCDRKSWASVPVYDVKVEGDAVFLRPRP